MSRRRPSRTCLKRLKLMRYKLNANGFAIDTFLVRLVADVPSLSSVKYALLSQLLFAMLYLGRRTV